MPDKLNNDRWLAMVEVEAFSRSQIDKIFKVVEANGWQTRTVGNMLGISGPSKFGFETEDTAYEAEIICRVAADGNLGRLLAKDVITLSEAERRWKKTNLRQNPPSLPWRWQSKDGRGTWLTTVTEMEVAFGPEPKE